MKVGKWEFRTGIQKFVKLEIITELKRFLNEEWLPVAVNDVDCWSITNLGIPSPIIRVDMAPVAKPGDLKTSIYEVEVRPAGLGLFLSLASSEATEEFWRGILRDCKCRGFINIESSIQDDKLAADLLKIPYYKKIPQKPAGPYWIRSNSRDGEIVELENISLVPIRRDGDKRYLVKLGLANEMKEKLDCSDWSRPFVVKPLIGSRMEGVEIYIPNHLKKKLGLGGSTKSRILRAISGEMPYLIQKFIPPQREEIDGLNGWLIWRLFFGWQIKNKYQFIGGLWNWRPNSLRVHGASDARFGLILER